MPEEVAAVPLNEDGTPKTAKQLEKEAKKAAKLAKFNEKQAKGGTAAGSTKKKSDDQNKEKKHVKKEEKKVVSYICDTAPGEKKDVSVELPGQYSPSYVEAAWYQWWKKQGFFKPEYGRDLSVHNPAGQFVMVIPPPNVTGSLHLGHALTNSVEDAITRWHRMKGRTTLWVPGCDHAGIATQVVVEKRIKRDEGKTRHDLGRDEFVKRVWSWKEEKGTQIYTQLERMGSSLDWDRATFTMDPGPQEAVQEAFLRLHDDGVIYRANRLVNWSCTLKSAISDIEVEKRELAGRTELEVPGYTSKVEFGVLVEFAYPVKDSSERLVVATTRLETMLGDTAVAVHPHDERYKHLHNKLVIHPITGEEMPILADSFVDMEFGTGAVKITPAHDPNDYDVGKRHGLKFINIFTDDGKIVPGYGEFSGLLRFECRVKLQIKLQELGSYVGTRDNPMVVPVCSRSKDIIEPMLKPQWYVRCAEMAADALAVVRSGELELIPKIHEKTWEHWMKEIRDWCISRQLWWGHRIPAYYVTKPGQETLEEGGEDASRWVCGRTEADARVAAAEKYGVEADSLMLEQDPDVLDTWFSSALFPFSVMGWPKKTLDMERFYPGTLLETGHDILFFWVARMVFFGRKLLGKLPFKQVYLHAMVRDAHGRKMSKSLGNVIDPIDVIEGITLQELHAQLEQNTNLDAKEMERAKAGQRADYPAGIPECGTDALRFALCAYTSQGRDINLDVLRVNGYRNFCNKLWNAIKFALTHLKPPFTPLASLQELKDKASLTVVDRWMLSQLAAAVRECNDSFATYNFPGATTALHSLWWYSICDVYLECCKPRLYGDPGPDRDAAQQVLWTCLHTGLRLISPFMPFLSEELFQRLPTPITLTSSLPASICVAPYPDTDDYAVFRDEAAEEQFKLGQKVITEVRSAKSKYDVPFKTKIELSLQCTNANTATALEALCRDIATLSCASTVTVSSSQPSGSVPTPVQGDCVAWMKLQGLVDLSKCEERLKKKMTDAQSKLAALTADMAKEHYSKVPADIKEKNMARLTELKAETAQNKDAIAHIAAIAAQQ